MGEVIRPEEHKLRLSISRLAAEFGMARETVSKRLRLAGVQPDGKRDGYPVYRLRDVAPALVDAGAVGADGEVDPDRMPPAERRAWFQSERERMDMEVRARALIPAQEHERDVARILGKLCQFCDTLPDVLERDESLAPHQVDRVQKLVDALREDLYADLVEDEGEGDVRRSA